MRDQFHDMNFIADANSAGSAGRRTSVARTAPSGSHALVYRVALATPAAARADDLAQAGSAMDPTPSYDPTLMLSVHFLTTRATPVRGFAQELRAAVLATVGDDARDTAQIKITISEVATMVVSALDTATSLAVQLYLETFLCGTDAITCTVEAARRRRSLAGRSLATMTTYTMSRTYADDSSVPAMWLASIAVPGASLESPVTVTELSAEATLTGATPDADAAAVTTSLVTALGLDSSALDVSTASAFPPSPPPPPRRGDHDGHDHDEDDHSGDGDGGANPCFARETTTACRVHDIAAPPADAYAQCFGEEGRGAAALRVLMTSLSAGDYVLTQAADGALAHTRVILNQHKVARDSDASSPLLTLYHDRGTLSLSPDHVLRVGGEFGPARTATAGAHLVAGGGAPARVSRVEVSRGGVVNPLTVSGTILAAGPAGAPVLASVYGEWIAEYVLGVATYPLPYSLASALAYLFPEHVQAYYDTVLEPPFLAGAAHLKSISAAAPSPVYRRDRLRL